MIEVLAGLMVGVCMVTAIYVVTFAVMFPRELELEFEGLKLLKAVLEIQMTLILEGKLK